MKKECKLALVALLVAASGCRAKPGDKCSTDVCDGAQRALVCIGGSYVSTSCSGPDGCASAPFRCDFRGNAAGDPCSDPTARSSCTPDKKARVRCDKGKVDREECDGPRACAPIPNSDTKVTCDRALRAGASCSIDGDWCATGGTDWLTCKGGKLVVASTCRGPAGCKPFAETVSCDVSLAQAEDPCVGTARACAVDGTSVLACRGGAMKLDSACPREKPCRPSADGASCGAK